MGRGQKFTRTKKRGPEPEGRSGRPPTTPLCLSDMNHPNPPPRPLASRPASSVRVVLLKTFRKGPGGPGDQRYPETHPSSSPRSRKTLGVVYQTPTALNSQNYFRTICLSTNMWIMDIVPRDGYHPFPRGPAANLMDYDLMSPPISPAMTPVSLHLPNRNRSAPSLPPPPSGLKSFLIFFFGIHNITIA